jgi:nitroreductase
MEFTKSVVELIRSRTSVRDYTSEVIPPETRAQLESACSCLVRGPLGTSCRFLLVERDRAGVGPAAALGTYGMIRGARTYLAGAARRGPSDQEDYGFLFEQLLLKAADLGLATCWLGGTFTRGGFAAAVGLGADEILPAVSPVGLPPGRRSLRDSAIRTLAGSRRRKPWAELFFDGGFATPLPAEGAGPYREALEMVRLAPSASNRQPWRLLRRDGAFHFYLSRTPGYGRVAGNDLQRLDIGIAMTHFQLTLTEGGVSGGWVRRAPAPEPPADTEYIVSWAAEA